MELKIETMGDNFKLQQKKEYPKPENIPRPPPTYQPKPQVALADVIPKSYETVVGRVVYLKTTERLDELGTKVIFTGCGIQYTNLIKHIFMNSRINRYYL